MSNVIDIVDRIKKAQDQDMYEYILRQLRNATSDAEKLYWTEIKLSWLFDLFYKQNGYAHENDPLGMEIDCYLPENEV